ncbi:RNA pyrophosphohydrolase [Pseudahrensia aquimaris]|uniref:RNA pyrophosphohydrolase n=1 Tax=Pseudahrensia aquimaris TaxID=744461 RepID=A0ABW3FDI5_9HYPH
MNEPALPYRPNVGIMVLNAEGKVWIGRRKGATNGSEYENQPQLWQMPQGGVDEGEELMAAALRELYEETGIKSVRVLDKTEDWIRYDFPPEVLGKKFEKWAGQKQMWFVFRFIGDETEIQVNPPPDGHKPEFDTWRWEDMASLPDLIVPFKRGVYEKVVARFERWANLPA